MKPWSKRHQKALIEQLEYYKKDDFPYEGVRPCPLCKSTIIDKEKDKSADDYKSKCSYCAWKIMTGKSCYLYGYKYSTKRIMELTEWIEYWEKS